MTMNYLIQKEFHISCGHHLSTLPKSHPCSRMHGHNYVIVLHLVASEGGLNAHGFVKDYRELDVFKQWLDEHFDHRYMCKTRIAGMPESDYVGIMQGIDPTAENIARFIYNAWCVRIKELAAVEVRETPKTSAFFGHVQ